MLRIGIDARLYGVESGTGIGRYTQELLRQFLEMTNDQYPMTNHWEFVVFLRRSGYEAFQPPNDHWTKVLADFRPYTIGVQTRYPHLIREVGVDLMHFTHFDHPVRCPVPFLITIHDLILLDHPSVRASTLGPLRFWMKYAAYQWVLRHAVDASGRILTPSQTVKEQVADRFGVLREKIIATPLGVEHVDRGQRAEGRGQSERYHQLETRASKLVPRNYLLYVGNAYPHKNLEQLIRVFPELTKRYPQLQLVLVGREDDFYRRLRRTAPTRTPIVFTGPIPETELRLLVAGASAYVSPSRSEGFDLPTVEALAAGVPVIASDIPVHREILGDAFVPFPVDNDAAFAEAIHRVLTRQYNFESKGARAGYFPVGMHAEQSSQRGGDQCCPEDSRTRSCPAGLIHSDIRATLRDRGIARAQRYSWRTCAAQTLSAYRELLACLALDLVRTPKPLGRRALAPGAGSPPPSSSPASTRG